MGDEEIAGLVVKMALDSGSFNDQLKDINNDMKIIESEFKATGASAQTFGNSLEGLQANLKRCNDVLELQKKAVDVYKQKVDESEKRIGTLAKKHEELASKIQQAKSNIEEATNTYGANSKEVEELNKELKNLENRYANNEKSLIRANSTLKTNTATYNNAIGKVKQYEQAIKSTEQDIENFGKAELSANDATKTLTTGIGILDVALGDLLSGGIMQLVEWLIEGIQYSMEFATTVDKVSQQIQMSNEDVQKWGYAFKTVGLDLESVSGDLANFNEKIQDTVNGTGDGAEVFTALGISVKNADGTLRSTSEVLQETVNKLQNMEDQTLRNAYASKLLSTTGEEMIPILNMTNEEFAKMQGKAGIVKEDDIAALKGLKESLLEFLDKVGKPIISMLGDMAKLLGPLIDLVGDFLEPILWAQEAFTEFLYGGLAEALGFVDETNDKIKDSNNKTMKGLKEGVDGLKEATDEATGYINKALDKFYNEELSNYEKELRAQFGDNLDLADEKYIQKKLAKYEARLQKEKERELEVQAEKYAQMEKRDNEYYNKLAQYQQNRNSINSSSRYPSYDTGTQYHLGGLAMVHKDELVELPRGAKVSTVNQSRDIIREINNTSHNSPVIIQNLNLQSDNAQDMITQIQILSRKGLV